MSWKLNGVSVEPEEVFAMLMHSESSHPLGFVIYGADSGLKAKVYKMFRGKLDKPLAFDRHGIAGPNIQQVKNTFREGRPVLVCMHGEDSVHHGLRHRIAKRLREFGAHTVIGIYVEVTRQDTINFAALSVEPSFSYQKYYRQIKKLREDPPITDGLDYYIVIDST